METSNPTSLNFPLATIFTLSATDGVRITAPPPRIDLIPWTLTPNLGYTCSITFLTISLGVSALFLLWTIADQVSTGFGGTTVCATSTTGGGTDIVGGAPPKQVADLKHPSPFSNSSMRLLQRESSTTRTKRITPYLPARLKSSPAASSETLSGERTHFCRQVVMALTLLTDTEIAFRSSKRTGLLAAPTTGAEVTGAVTLPVFALRLFTGRKPETVGNESLRCILISTAVSPSDTSDGM
ncbi:uncharacterized protein ACN427_013886 [Glossina fuscipes fuscipes]